MASTNAGATFPGKIEPGTQTAHNTVIKWHTAEKGTFGYASFPESPVNFYSMDAAGLIERRARRMFGIPPDKFGLSVDHHSNISLFLSEPAGPFLPGYAPAPGFGMRFFSMMALHEFGLVIGLHHPPKGCSPLKTVMGRGGKSWTTPTWTGQDRFVTWPTDRDKEAVRRIYQQP
jgi:hypothetical protein